MKSPFRMGIVHACMGNLHSEWDFSMREWEISIHRAPFQQALAPSGLAGMDGAVASLRHDAFECENGRRAASASATRPSTASYRVIYY
jgi:hypothetical protein